MDVTTVETPGLGDRSYLVSDGRLAVVVDPQRDIDRITDLLAQEGLDLALVCETHIHNDYVTGGLTLARSFGADYAINAADDVSFARRGVREGEVMTIGDMTIKVVATPGHTPTHLAYVVEMGDRRSVFTGGSMLYGTVGRTDLISPDQTEQLTRDQHRSVRRLATGLDAATAVHPTHGFGSFCSSAGGASRTSGTIKDERDENIAMTMDDEDGFVEQLMNGFSAHPPYYSHMGLLNRAGPQPVDLSPPPRTGPDELAQRIRRGEWVVDLRGRESFAGQHLAGSVSVEMSDSLATYLGWAIPWGTPLTLVGDDEEQVVAAQRELVRIGIDRPLAMATGGPDVYGKDQELGSYPMKTFSDLQQHPDATIVDVRRQDEWDDGHIADAIHVPMERVAKDAESLPDGRLWVHCASGFRASVASSLIARAGGDVVWINDEWENADQAGRSIQSEE